MGTVTRTGFRRLGQVVVAPAMVVSLMGALLAGSPARAIVAPALHLIAAPSVGPNVNITKEGGNQSEGDIAVNPTNPKQVFAESNETFSALMAATSGDAGATWSRRDIATGTDGLPAACCDGSVSWDNFGNLFLAYLDANTSAGSVHVAVSTDGGATFTVVGNIGSGNVDQPTIRTGPGNGAGIGSAWVTYTDASNNIATSASTVTGLGSANIGAFSAPFQVPGSAGGDFGDVAVGPAGQVMTTWEAPHGGLGPANLLVSTNTMGLSNLTAFGAAVTVTSTNVGGFDPIPAQRSRTIDAEPSLAWDRSGKTHSGRIYFAYTDAAAAGANPPTVASANTDTYVRFSDNNGATWSARVKVNDDTGTNSQFLPNIAVDQTTGELALSWYDARNDLGTGGSGDTNSIANDDAQFWGATSTDGVTFSANFQISAGTSNSADANNGINYGDYTHAAYFGGLYYAYWADNSNSTGDNPNGTLKQLDMYVAKVGIHVAHTTLTNTASPTDGRAPLAVTYTYHEVNDGTDPISGVVVTDDTCSPVTFTGGDTNANGLLDPGETWNYTCSHTFTTAGTFTNTATATGTDTITALAAPTETATATVKVRNPHTVLTKTASPTTGPFPLPVTFTYHEQNDGTDPISGVVVTDDTCSPVTFTGGDTNSNGILDPGETWNYTCTHTYNQPGSLTNHATATGTDTVDSMAVPVEKAQATVTVTCDHTITGSVPGTVILGPGGAWCIQNAQVGGGVIVKPGTAVFIGNSTLGGAIVSSGATAFSLCGSTVVGGSSDIHDSTGFVTIGDPGDDSCGGNNIHGSLSLRNNSAGLEVIANTISGGLVVSGTSGTGPFPEDTQAEIEANHLGSLTCSANVPPPTSEGDVNTVAGAKTGQCAVGF